jgi:hypothetical protein
MSSEVKGSSWETENDSMQEFESAEHTSTDETDLLSDNESTSQGITNEVDIKDTVTEKTSDEGVSFATFKTPSAVVEKDSDIELFQEILVSDNADRNDMAETTTVSTVSTAPITSEGGEEWGEYESNCSVTSNDSMGEHDPASVDMQSATDLTISHIPHPNPPTPQSLENEVASSATSASSAPPASAESGPAAPEETKDAPTTPEPAKSKKKSSDQPKHVKFGEDKVTIYDTGSSPNRVLLVSDVSESKTKMTYADGSVYEGEVCEVK